ncbi:hypothetical protein MRX96_025234 [Rhipicephalus microplus]
MNGADLALEQPQFRRLPLAAVPACFCFFAAVRCDDVTLLGGCFCFERHLHPPTTVVTVWATPREWRALEREMMPDESLPLGGNAIKVLAETSLAVLVGSLLR